ncbi:MAG: hypothetical protein FJ045_04320 [Crenarchaeota archaeon]|nr:hypothetical protein [Thermoproteota archaeon]
MPDLNSVQSQVAVNELAKSETTPGLGGFSSSLQTNKIPEIMQKTVIWPGERAPDPDVLSPVSRIPIFAKGKVGMLPRWGASIRDAEEAEKELYGENLRRIYDNPNLGKLFKIASMPVGRSRSLSLTEQPEEPAPVPSQSVSPELLQALGASASPKKKKRVVPTTVRIRS